MDPTHIQVALLKARCHLNCVVGGAQLVVVVGGGAGCIHTMATWSEVRNLVVIEVGEQAYGEAAMRVYECFFQGTYLLGSCGEVAPHDVKEV